MLGLVIRCPGMYILSSIQGVCIPMAYVKEGEVSVVIVSGGGGGVSRGGFHLEPFQLSGLFSST